MQNNFKYLDDLIRSGAKEIVLDSDIVLSDDEESEYNDGIKLDVDDLVIDGNGHSIDANGKVRIFICSGKNIIIKNIVLKNGSAVDGGAIFVNEGIVHLIDSSLLHNMAKDDGGAIANIAKLSITESSFDGNNATMGGAIVNIGELSIVESTFSKNKVKEGGALFNVGKLIITESQLFENKAEYAGGAITNHKNMDIINCGLSNNESSCKGGAILNCGNLTIIDSILSGNLSQNFDESMIVDNYHTVPLIQTPENMGGAIYNEAMIELGGSELTDNSAYVGGAIYNDMGIIKIENALFNDNKSHEEYTQDFWNNGELILNEFHFISFEKTILNLKDIKLQEKMEYKICNKGCLSYVPIDENSKNFTYLDQLIHSGQKDIKLENDILLDRGIESEKYREGILIDVNDITLDGNGHSIDADQTSRIFKTTGKNITIKNLTLKNGFAEKYGGAVINDGTVLFKNSRFVNNLVQGNGGAIFNINNGIIEMESCKLEFNKSTKEGIKNTKKGVKGGAIFNCGMIKITDTPIIYNSAISAEFPTISEGGAIYNAKNADLTLIGCRINNNTSMIEGSEFNHYITGGAILNRGITTIKRCEIKKNKSGENIISNTSKMSIFNCIIENNHTNDSASYLTAVLSNNDDYFNSEENRCVLNIESTHIKNNNSKHVLFNSGNCSLNKVNMINNSVEVVLFNSHSCSIRKTTFDKNNFENTNLLNMYNKGFLTIKDSKITDIDYKSILNEGKIILYQYLEGIIDNKGIIKYGFREEENNDFTKLNDLILSNEKIILEDDYFFEEYEIDFFEGGIELDRDGTVIDGQNHIICGNFMSRMFVVTGKNIVLKNIIFKNGNSFKNYENSRNSEGGVIRINKGADLIIEYCQFEDNASEKNGGVITNSGVINIKSSNIKQGEALNGGAINNLGEIRIYDTILEKNTAERNGGAIYNNGTITMENTTIQENCITHDNFFYNNRNSRNGGAICNNTKGKVTIIKSKLLENTVFTSKDDAYDCNGGAISNFGKLSIVNSTFEKNTTKVGNIDFQAKGKKNTSNGGAIDNSGIMTISHSKFINNKSISGGAINNKGMISILGSILSRNIVEGRYMVRSTENLNPELKNALWNIKVDFAEGGAIKNLKEGNITLNKVALTQNVADYGGAISNKGLLKIEDSELNENQAHNQGGAIYSEIGTASSINTDFSNNDAGNGKTELKVFSKDEVKGLTRNSWQLRSMLLAAENMETLYLKGGAIWVKKKNTFKLIDCKFTDNAPDNVYFDDES